jgi:hypothetical protein
MCTSWEIYNSSNSQRQQFPQQKHLTPDDGLLAETGRVFNFNF